MDPGLHKKILAVLQEVMESLLESAVKETAGQSKLKSVHLTAVKSLGKYQRSFKWETAL